MPNKPLNADAWLVAVTGDSGTEYVYAVEAPSDVNEYPNVLESAVAAHLASENSEDYVNDTRVVHQPMIVYVLASNACAAVETVWTDQDTAIEVRDSLGREMPVLAVRPVNSDGPTPASEKAVAEVREKVRREDLRK